MIVVLIHIIPPMPYFRILTGYFLFCSSTNQEQTDRLKDSTHTKCMFDDAMISISNRKESESVAMKRTCSNGSIRSRHTRTNCLPRGCIISQSSYHHRRNVGSCSPTGGGGGRRFKSENPFPQPMADLLVMLFCLLSAREIMAFSNNFHGMPTGGRLRE